MKRMFMLSVAFHVGLAMMVTVISANYTRFPEQPVFFEVDLIALPKTQEQKMIPQPVREVSPPKIVKKVEKPVEPPKPKKVTKALPELKTIDQKPEVVVPDPKREEPKPSAEPETAVASVPSVTTKVEVPDFRFPYYLKLIQGKIGSQWAPPPVQTGGEPQEVVISFYLVKSGKVHNIQVETSSGNSFYDQAALRAVYMSDPLPPFPPGLRDPNLKVLFSFTLSRES